MSIHKQKISPAPGWPKGPKSSITWYLAMLCSSSSPGARAASTMPRPSTHKHKCQPSTGSDELAPARIRACGSERRIRTKRIRRSETSRGGYRLLVRGGSMLCCGDTVRVGLTRWGGHQDRAWRVLEHLQRHAAAQPGRELAAA
jgi:hypothetical protein